jgi:uncharacterized protein with PIN domain
MIVDTSALIAILRDSGLNAFHADSAAAIVRVGVLVAAAEDGSRRMARMLRGGPRHQSQAHSAVDAVVWRLSGRTRSGAPTSPPSP